MNKSIEKIIVDIIKKANNRIESACPFFFNCGGCDLLHLSYENSLKFKQDKIQNIKVEDLDMDILDIFLRHVKSKSILKLSRSTYTNGLLS